MRIKNYKFVALVSRLKLILFDQAQQGQSVGVCTLLQGCKLVKKEVQILLLVETSVFL